MGQDTIQPTPIDREEYEAFRAFVKDAHGKVRGNLAREVENALREYRQPENTTDQLTRIEDDLATLKAQLADAESDGGTTAPTPSDDQTTRPRNSDKPAPNQPRYEKIQYLLGELYETEPVEPSGGELAPDVILELVQTEYNFAGDTAEGYVADIVDELGAEENPLHGRTIVWGDKLEEEREKVGTKIDEVSR